MRYFILFSLLALAACTNPFTQYYHGRSDAKETPYYEEVAGEIKINPSQNLEKDSRALARKGFFRVGFSAFNGGSNNFSPEALDILIRAQAKKIGAQVVLFNTNYTHTESGALPLILPNNSTSYSTGSATAYGSAGVVNAYGNSTTTTYGSQTVMMPYSIPHSDFVAFYFAKTKSRLGTFLSDSELDTKTRRGIGTNAGLEVVEVVIGSPAFKANIFPGDIMLSIGDITISSHDDYETALDKYEDQAVTIKLYRDGKTLTKKVKILKLVKNEPEKKP